MAEKKMMSAILISDGTGSVGKTRNPVQALDRDLNARIGLVNKGRPIPNSEQQVPREDEVEAVLLPRPFPLNVVEFKATVWRHPTS